MAAWAPMASGTARMLNDVWGSSGSDVFAASDNGTVLHYDGRSWSAADSGAAVAFHRLAASDAMMFGRRGFILRGPETIGKAVDGPAEWAWGPVAGGGSSTGDLGWTAGEAVITPEGGAAIKTKYLSVWRTDSAGAVRFILDIGNSRP